MSKKRGKEPRAAGRRPQPSPPSTERRRSPALTAIIFVTGGTILALELLASRIMTPYFGVSLYIWSGILSITLVALAIGYWFGGWLGRRETRRRPGREGILHLYLLMPALAAFSLAAAALIYPWAFVELARFDLIIGSFIACVILLFVPLVVTSAMNPLLVAIRNTDGDRNGEIGDAGSGTVFFVSTLGSVAGVPVAAFGLIPYFTNFASVLGIGIVLAGLTGAAALGPGLRGENRARLVALAVGGVFFCGTLLVFSDSYLGKTSGAAADGRAWTLEREYVSTFGNIKVMRVEEPAQPERYERFYFQDGLIQNRVDPAGNSLSLFTYALEALALTYRPEPESALVLGLGGGLIPMRMSALGIPVEIVEINPESWRAARDYFGFEPEHFRNHIEDARTFVRRCKGRHDVVLVDLFQGDGVPEHLLTREFFQDLRDCMTERGVAAFNTFGAADNSDGYAHLLATLKAVFRTVAVFGAPAPADRSTQKFLLATDRDVDVDRQIVVAGMPPELTPRFNATLAGGVVVDAGMIRDGLVVTERANFLPAIKVHGELAYRRAVVAAFPPQWLVN